VESGTKVDLDFVARGIAIFNPYPPKCTLQMYPTFQSLPSLFQVYPRHQSFYLETIFSPSSNFLFPAILVLYVFDDSNIGFFK
jgi:hypothetical protein